MNNLITLVYIIENENYNKSLETILNQTFDDYKLIILDTNNFILNYNDDRIEYKQINKNSISENIFYELLNCKTKYAMILNSNNYYNSDILEIFYNGLEKSNFPNIIFGGYNFCKKNYDGINMTPSEFLIKMDINFPIMFKTRTLNNMKFTNFNYKTDLFIFYLNIMKRHKNLICVNEILTEINKVSNFNEIDIENILKNNINGENIININLLNPFPKIKDNKMVSIALYDFAINIINSENNFIKNFFKENLYKYFELSYNYNNDNIASLINFIIFINNTGKNTYKLKKMLDNDNLKILNEYIVKNLYYLKNTDNEKINLYINLNKNKNTIVNLQSKINNILFEGTQNISQTLFNIVIEVIKNINTDGIKTNIYIDNYININNYVFLKNLKFYKKNNNDNNIKVSLKDNILIFKCKDKISKISLEEKFIKIIFKNTLYKYFFYLKPFTHNLVSVIIPYYNKIKFIKKALESLLLQEYQNFEVIIVNDNPNDNESENIILEFTNKMKIIYIKNNTNIKTYNTRNVGIFNSNGEFITILDPDDIFKETRLLDDINFLKTNKKHQCVMSKFQRYNYYTNELIKDCKYGETIITFRKSIFCNYGFYQNTPFGGDTEFRDRIIKCNKKAIGLLDKTNYIAYTELNDNNLTTLYSTSLRKLYAKKYKYMHANKFEIETLIKNINKIYNL